MEDRSRIIKQLHLRSWLTKIQLGSLRERCKLPQRGPKWNWVHFSFTICHLVATSLLIFPKLYQPEKSQPKEKTFFFSRPCRGPIFLNGPNAAASIAPALIRHCFFTPTLICGGSVAEWSACWTQAQKGLGSNRSRDAVG